jgi:hypothetical protein
MAPIAAEVRVSRDLHLGSTADLTGQPLYSINFDHQLSIVYCYTVADPEFK